MLYVVRVLQTVCADDRILVIYNLIEETNREPNSVVSMTRKGKKILFRVSVDMVGV